MGEPLTGGQFAQRLLPHPISDRVGTANLDNQHGIFGPVRELTPAPGPRPHPSSASRSKLNL